jgi:hypothetical protein
MVRSKRRGVAAAGITTVSRRKRSKLGKQNKGNPRTYEYAPKIRRTI